MTEFEQLKHSIQSCRKCKTLFEHDPVPIFRGYHDAFIMQISQAPSLKVQQSNLPFNDVSGKKLKYDWYDINDETFYNEHNFYITSIGHCYPGKAKCQGDKKPPKQCADTWLKKEMDVVQNKIYVIIGAIAASYLFPEMEFDTLVFNNQQLNGKLTFVLPHPSPLNCRWLHNHPAFEEERMPYIRDVVKSLLPCCK